jgi:hypothetical protein
MKLAGRPRRGEPACDSGGSRSIFNVRETLPSLSISPMRPSVSFPVFRACAVLLAALAFTRSAHAQAEPVSVRAGSTLVDASRVTARTDTFALVTVSVNVVLVIATEVDSARIVRRERIVTPEGIAMSMDSFTAMRPSLVPLADAARHPSMRRTLRFDGAHVTGSIAFHGAARDVDTRLDPPAFWMNSTDLLLASIPLAPGKRYRVAMYDPDRGPYDLWLDVRGVEETTSADGGRCQAWRVEAVEMGAASTYWVERTSQALLAYRHGDLELRIRRHPACPLERGDRTAR